MELTESPTWQSGISLSKAKRFGRFQVKNMMQRYFLFHHCKPTVCCFDSACQITSIDNGAGARLSFLLESTVYFAGLLLLLASTCELQVKSIPTVQMSFYLC